MFHELFPFLRLEFARENNSRKFEPLFLNRTFKDVCHVDPETLIVADDQEKYIWLRHKFKSAFNLNVKVFKKIGIRRWKELSEKEMMNLSDINRNCEVMNKQLKIS